MTIFTGQARDLACDQCGAPLVPPFALLGDCETDPCYALCPQPGCGARTRVARMGDVLLAWKVP